MTEGIKTKPRVKRACKAKTALAPLDERLAQQRDRQKARNLQRDERPKSVIGRSDSILTIGPAPDQDDKLYAVATMEALGTRSIPFLNVTLDGLIRVMSPSRDVTADQYNAGLAILAAIEPENELEATLGAQMVAANDCAMRCMRSMVGSDHADHHKMYGDLANKFLRTFAAQTEALSKLRRGGEQVVKYIHVHEGGQAVVAGTINQGGRGIARSAEQPLGAEMPGERAALSGPDPSRDGVPVPSDAEWSMPDSRRAKSGGAAR